MKRSFCTILVTILTISLMSHVTMADDRTTVGDLLKKNIDKVISILKQKDLKQEEKNCRIIEIVTPMFDFSLMAKLTLGKKHWPELSKEQQKQFEDVFVKHLKASYLEKLNLYSDEIIVYKPPIQVKKKIYVPTDLISKGNTISMLYKFWKSKKGWKIYDLEIAGVSVVQSYRSQFDQVLSNGTFEDLLKELENLGQK